MRGHHQSTRSDGGGGIGASVAAAILFIIVVGKLRLLLQTKQTILLSSFLYALPTAMYSSPPPSPPPPSLLYAVSRLSIQQQSSATCDFWRGAFFLLFPLFLSIEKKSGSVESFGGGIFQTHPHTAGCHHRLQSRVRWVGELVVAWWFVIPPLLNCTHTRAYNHSEGMRKGSRATDESKIATVK